MSAIEGLPLGWIALDEDGAVAASSPQADELTRGADVRSLGAGRHYLGAPGRWVDVQVEAAGRLIYLRDVNEEHRLWQRTALCGQIARILASAASFRAAGGTILQAVCESLGWDLAAMWELPPGGQALRCVEHWCSPRARERRFLEATYQLALERGQGLPGAVWARRAPVYFPAFASDRFPRWKKANRLRCGLAFPLVGRHDRFVGVMEFFGQDPPPDVPGALDLLGSVASQIGNVLDDWQAEDESGSESRGWLESVLGNLGVAIVGVAPDATVAYANRGVESLTGWAPTRAVGRPVDTVVEFAEGHAPTLAALVSSALSGTPSGAQERRLSTGAWVELEAVPVWEDGDLTGAVLVLRDMTARRQALERVAESEQRFAQLVARTSEGVWQADADYRTLDVNPRLCEMLGYTREELLGTRIADHLAEGSRAELPRRIQARKQGLSEQYDLEFLRRDGSTIWLHASASPILDENGAFNGSFAMLTDITEKRRRRAALRQSEERYRSLVEATSLALLVADGRGRVREDSPSWRGVTGQAYSELRGLGWLEAVHADDRAGLRSSWQHAVSTGAPFTEHFRAWSVSNRFVQLRGTAVPVPSVAGQPAEWILANADITPAVEAQRRLEERFRFNRFRAAIKNGLTSPEPLDFPAGCCQAMVDHLGLGAAFVWQLAASDALVLRSAAGEPIELELDRLALGEHEIGRMAELARGHFTTTLRSNFDHPAARRLADSGWVSFAGQPVLEHGQVVGVVAGFSRTVLSADAMLELKLVAESLAQWGVRRRSQTERASLLAREQEARERAETLFSLALTFGRARSLEELLQAVTDAGTRLSGAAFGAFFYNLVGEKGESYLLYTISGVDRSHFASFPMPRNTEVFGPTFRGEETVRSDDITRDPRYGKNRPYRGLPPGHLPVRSYLAVPVKLRSGEVAGGLFFGHPEAGVFTRSAATLTEGVAVQAAYAIEQAGWLA